MKPRKTQYLFTYGTLRNEEIQQNIFGRKTKGRIDWLIAYRISEKKLLQRYPVIERTGLEKDRVKGVVYEVSHLELHKADEYETDAYKRIEVVLKSKVKAWVYVENTVS